MYDNNWVPNQHIRIVSEESRDTEDWSNDAENSNLQPQDILYIYTLTYYNRNVLFKIVIIFHSITVLQYVWSNKLYLISQGCIYFKKTLQIQLKYSKLLIHTSFFLSAN